MHLPHGYRVCFGVGRQSHPEPTKPVVHPSTIPQYVAPLPAYAGQFFRATVEGTSNLQTVPSKSNLDNNRRQVKRQRERFRKEALRREREASIAKGNAEQLTRDNQDLRRENMHLYKKIRRATGTAPRAISDGVTTDPGICPQEHGRISFLTVSHAGPRATSCGSPPRKYLKTKPSTNELGCSLMQHVFGEMFAAEVVHHSPVVR